MNAAPKEQERLTMFGPDRPQKRELLDMDGLPLPPRPEHIDPLEVAKYERNLQAAFNAEAEHRDCCCGDDLNPFCKTHSDVPAPPPKGEAMSGERDEAVTKMTAFLQLAVGYAIQGGHLSDNFARQHAEPVVDALLRAAAAEGQS